MDIFSFARLLDDYIRERHSSHDARCVELIRRTRRGGLQVQFCSNIFAHALEILGERDIPLDRFGVWRVSRDSTRLSDLMSIVVSRVPMSMSPDDFTEELLLSNEARIPGFDSDLLRSSVHSISRLSRRQVDMSGTSTWIPSLSLRCIVSRKLGEALLHLGSLVIGYRPVEVRVYHPPVRFCFHCGREGHLARFCRSPPKCRRCGEGHALRDCPLRSSLHGPSERAHPSVTARRARHGDLGGAQPSPSTCH